MRSKVQLIGSLSLHLRQYVPPPSGKVAPGVQQR
jgi:hypothetical protein